MCLWVTLTRVNFPDCFGCKVSDAGTASSDRTGTKDNVRLVG